MNKRRIIIRSVSVIAAASAAGMPFSSFAALEKVDEKDPQAVSLGYQDDTTKVDQGKFPKHEPSQVCSGCQFYGTAQATKQLGPCTIFGGKAVSAKGWCSAYVKKAA